MPDEATTTLEEARKSYFTISGPVAAARTELPGCQLSLAREIGAVAGQHAPARASRCHDRVGPVDSPRGSLLVVAPVEP